MEGKTSPLADSGIIPVSKNEEPRVVARQSSNSSSLLPYKKRLYFRAPITHEEGNMARGMEDLGKGQMSKSKKVVIKYGGMKKNLVALQIEEKKILS